MREPPACNLLSLTARRLADAAARKSKIPETSSDPWTERHKPEPRNLTYGLVLRERQTNDSLVRLAEGIDAL